MAAEGVMDKKPKSRDRGASWQKVVNNLIMYKKVSSFKVGHTLSVAQKNINYVNS